ANTDGHSAFVIVYGCARNDRRRSSGRRVGGLGGRGALRHDQLWKHESNGGALPRLAVDVEAELLAGENFQALADVGNADAGLIDPRLFFGRKPIADVGDFEVQ